MKQSYYISALREYYRKMYCKSYIYLRIKILFEGEKARQAMNILNFVYTMYPVLTTANVNVILFSCIFH